MAHASGGELLTLQQAADELQVHYMTAYRWVRRGDLPASKTGGRLRVRRADLDSFVTTRQVDTAMPRKKAVERRDWDKHVARLTEMMLAGQHHESISMVTRLVSDGATASEVYTQLLTPSLHQIGADWEEGHINVAVEHRATEIAGAIMGRLSVHFRRRGPRRGIAVTLTPPGETHGVAATMVADFLRGAGWEVHHLGVDVPLHDLGLFLEIVPADVVCVSVAARMPADYYAELVEVVGERELVIGGSGADLTIAEPLGVTVLEDPFTLVTYLEKVFA